MELTNLQAIGTHFKKENIFFATLFPSEEYVFNELKSKYKIKHFDGILKKWVKKDILKYNEVDIFYKDENGYTRYLGESPDTYAGDNSDGRGYLRNIVSAWDYYPEGELLEAMVDGKFTAIVDNYDEGLEKYNEDYNKGFKRGKVEY